MCAAAASKPLDGARKGLFTHARAGTRGRIDAPTEDRMTRSLRAVLALSASVAAAGAVAAPPPPLGQWPQWRGPLRDAVSRETGLLPSWKPGGPALAWKAGGLGAGFSSVALAGGRIYTLGDVDGAQHLIALDGTSGRILWKTKIGPVWEDQFPGPRGTPTVDGDRVYAIGTEGDLVSVDAATGREHWRRSLPRDFGGVMMSMWKFSESPLVDGDRVVFTPGGPTAGLAAVDKRTGRDVWRTAIPDLGPKGKPGAAYSGIVISDGAGVRQYVQLMGKGVVGVRASDGKFLWGYNRVANDVANIPTPIVKGDLPPATAPAPPCSGS
jgi:outer membrane protein assembly factor BamB